MIKVISIIASKYVNIDNEKLWTPTRYFTDSVHFLSKEIAGVHKP